MFVAAGCGCRDPVRAPLKHEWATWLFWQKNLFCFAERVNKNGIKLHYSMKICSILTFSLKCNTWQLWLRLEFVLYNRVNSKTKSVLFSVINTQNVQKHTKNLNISFVVTLAGQNCGPLELSRNSVYFEARSKSVHGNRINMVKNKATFLKCPLSLFKFKKCSTQPSLSLLSLLLVLVC